MSNFYLRLFQTSSKVLSSLPTRQTCISQRALAKNLRHIRHLKQKLGDKYKIIGRDKRLSPFSERNKSTKPSQPLPQSNVAPPLASFLYTQTNLNPDNIIYGDIKANWIKVVNQHIKNDISQEKNATQNSIRMPTVKADVRINASTNQTKLVYNIQ
jgi:hypothetical protein